MSKENVVKFYDEAKKNDKLKAEFENLQNELQKTEQVKDFDSLAEKIVYIGKKYNFDFSKEELNSYLEDLKSNLTDEDLLNISGGRLSPKVAAIGTLGVLGISFATGAAVKMSQFPSSTATQQEAVLSNEDNADNDAKETESEDQYDGENRDNDALNPSISNNVSNPRSVSDRTQQPSHAPDANLLKTLFGNRRNDKVKNESPSLTVASQQKSTSAVTSSQKENSSPDAIVNKEEKTSRGIFDQDNTTLDAVQSMFLDAEAEAENIAKIKNVENKGSGWVYVSLKDGEDSFTISRGSLQYLANMTSMNVNDIKYIWVNNGQVAPTLSNDIREIFSEPSDVQWRALGGVYQNAVKRFTEEETKAKEAEEINKLMTAGSGYNEDQITRNLADLNVKSAKKDGNWLMLTLENKDKGVTITKENLSTLARVAGFKNVDEVQYIQVENGDVSPTLGANLQETFSEPRTVKGWFGSYKNTVRRLNKEKKVNKSNEETREKGTDKIAQEESSHRELQVTKNLANLNVKSVKYSQGAFGPWLEITLLDESKGITITKENLSMLAEAAGFANADIVQYILINGGEVAPTLGADLKEVFSKPGKAPGFWGSYQNTLHRLSADEIKIQKLVLNQVEEDLAEFIVEQNVSVTNSDGVLDDGKLKIAEIMHKQNVDKDRAEEIYKLTILDVEQDLAAFIVKNNIEVMTSDNSLNTKELGIARIMKEQNLNKKDAERQQIYSAIFQDFYSGKPKTAISENEAKELTNLIVINGIDVIKDDGTLDKTKLKIAEVMHANQVSQEVAELMIKTNVGKETAKTMVAHQVDEDSAIQINKIEGVANDGNGNLTVTLGAYARFSAYKGVLKYLATKAGIDSNNIQSIKLADIKASIEVGEDLQDEYQRSYGNNQYILSRIIKQ